MARSSDGTGTEADPAQDVAPRLHRSHIDSILGMVALASADAGPRRGMSVAIELATAMIALLFFLHGAQLSPEVALGGARHWRLHAMVFVSTFVLFPLLGLPRARSRRGCYPAALGRAAAAVRAAVNGAVLDRVHLDRPRQRAGGAVRGAASNLLGIVLTPLLAGFC